MEFKPQIQSPHYQLREVLRNCTYKHVYRNMRYALGAALMML